MTEEATRELGEHELDDTALEALAEVHATPPPPALRARMLAEARREADGRRVTRVLRRSRLVGAVAAAAVLTLAGLLAREARRAGVRDAELAALARTNAALTAKLEEQGRVLAGLRESLDAQAQVLRVVGGPRTLTASLAPQAGVVAGGRVLVDAASGEAAVVVSGLDPAGEGKVYELWAIRGNHAPDPAGLFSVGAGRAVAARVDRIERPAEVTAFAISVEPTGGSKAPTGPIVLVGPVAG